MSQEASVRIKTTGMHCQSCAMLVQMNVEDLPGITSVKVDVAAEETAVTFDPDAVSAERIVEAIEAAGYGAALKV
jgi:copper chaperone CopZ